MAEQSAIGLTVLAHACERINKDEVSHIEKSPASTAQSWREYQDQFSGSDMYTDMLSAYPTHINEDSLRASKHLNGSLFDGPYSGALPSHETCPHVPAHVRDFQSLDSLLSSVSFLLSIDISDVSTDEAVLRYAHAIVALVNRIKIPNIQPTVNINGDGVIGIGWMRM